MVLPSPSQNASTRQGEAQSLLPPSLNVSSDTVKVEIKYQLRAVVVRSGFMNRDIATIRKIQIQPLQPPDPFDDQNIAATISSASSGTALPLALYRADQSASTTSSNEVSSMFEIKCSAPRLLRPGRTLDVRVSICIPVENQSTLMPVWLTSLVFRLVVRTTVRSSRSDATDTAHFTLWSYSGFLPTILDEENECFTIPDSLWNRSVIPSLTPSFDCCGVSRSYQLQIIASISPASKSRVWVSNSSTLCRFWLTYRIRTVPLA